MWKLIIFKYIAQSCADVHFNYMLSWWFSWCHVQLFTTPWTVALQAPRPWDFPGKNTGVRCHFLLLGIFSTEGSDLHVLHCRQVLSLLSHQANLMLNLCPLGLTGLISLLSKGLYKSLLQHHSPKALILQCSAFFMVQLSHLYMTTGNTIALTIQTLSAKWYCCF